MTVLSRGGEQALSEADRQTLRLADAYGKAHGISYVVVDTISDGRANALYAGGNTIFVAADIGLADGGMSAAIGHDTWHYITETIRNSGDENAEQYIRDKTAELLGLLKDLDGYDYDARRAAIREANEKLGEDLDEDRLDEEQVGNGMFELIISDEAVRSLAETDAKTGDNFLQKLKEALEAVVQRIRNAAARYGVAEARALVNVEEALAKFNEVANQAVRLADAARRSEESGVRSEEIGDQSGNRYMAREDGKKHVASQTGNDVKSTRKQIAHTNNDSSIKWVYDNELFTDADSRMFHSQISELNNSGFKFISLSDGNYFLQLDSCFVVTNGDYDEPKISRLCKVLDKDYYSGILEVILDEIRLTENNRANAQQLYDGIEFAEIISPKDYFTVYLEGDTGRNQKDIESTKESRGQGKNNSGDDRRVRAYRDDGRENLEETKRNEIRKYLEAAKAGDMPTAQKMVDKAAEKALSESKARGINGKLLHLRHGTDDKFTVFDWVKHGGRHGTGEGSGINLTDDSEVANKFGGRVLDFYADIRRPATSWKKTITRSELAHVIEASCKREAERMVRTEGYINVNEALNDTWISNYVNTYDYWYIQDAYREVADTLFNGNDNDRDIVQELLNAQGGLSNQDISDFYDNVLTPITGIDGLWTKWKQGDGSESNIILAFKPEQVKSAEAVTYDDDGNIIPVTERFNTNEKDFRFMPREDDFIFDDDDEEKPYNGEHDFRLTERYSEAVSEFGFVGDSDDQIVRMDPESYAEENRDVVPDSGGYMPRDEQTRRAMDRISKTGRPNPRDLERIAFSFDKADTNRMKAA